MRTKITTQILLCMFSVLFSPAVFAQQKTITGTVKDDKGQVLPGVSVTVKGTSTAVSTDEDGKYSIPASPGSTLVFRYIGFAQKELPVGTSSVINVNLNPAAETLGEVVVTALGIKREKKSLGYAVQEVKGETLTEARETNLVNSLSGKVAGLQITRSGNGPAGSSKISIPVQCQYN